MTKRITYNGEQRLGGENIVKKKKVPLSRRLQMLADMVTPGNSVADVGCDHGFLSVYLVQQGISPKVIASDVRQGPLSAAREHIAEYGLEEYIETRLSDGLMEFYPGEADTLVCSGMGGRLMQQILTQSEPVTREFSEMILQPQSEQRQFRIFLREQGYRITQERIVCEDEKYYFAFRVVQPGADDTGGMKTDIRSDAKRRLYDRFGEQLLKEGNPVLREYLEKCLKTGEAVQTEILAHRGTGGNARLEQSLAETSDDVEEIRTALEMFYKIQGREGKRV